MRFSAPHVRIADVETCDFAALRSYTTPEVLRAALPDRWSRWLDSPVARALLTEIGVERRFLTQVPGTPVVAGRLTALDLARSAVERLRARRAAELEALDAVVFVSTSNPNPCNSQASLLANAMGLGGSCFDLKAGCSSGVLGLLQGALMIEGGCRRVLVVMAETLSQLTDPADARMLLSVGDGAACVLLERGEAPGFRVLAHGTAPEFAHAMEVREPFPPTGPQARFVYEISDAGPVREALAARWRSLFAEMLAAGNVKAEDLARWWIHQTHAGQLAELARDTGIPPERMPAVVGEHGNMGSPTFAVAMARDFAALRPGDDYLVQAVGGGMSWCAILARHS
jgi:3-oxoacyl-[acyl-carrier-protein] synthase-3